MLLDSEHTEASFSPNSTYSLCVQLAQVRTSPDLAIFLCPRQRQRQRRHDRSFYPCACARGNNIMLLPTDLPTFPSYATRETKFKLVRPYYMYTRGVMLISNNYQGHVGLPQNYD